MLTKLFGLVGIILNLLGLLCPFSQFFRKYVDVSKGRARCPYRAEKTCFVLSHPLVFLKNGYSEQTE